MILRIFICIFSIKVHQLAEGAPTPLDPGGEWPGHIPGQVRWGRARGRWSPNREVYPLFGHWPPPPPPEVGWACLPNAWPPDLCQNLLPQKVNLHLFTNLVDLWWCYKGVAHTCVHKDPIDKLANKCLSFIFPGFLQPVRGKRMLAEYERGCAVYLGTGPHTSQEGSGRRVVTLRILLMNGPRRRSADRWPSRSPTWTKAPPQTWFRLFCLTFSNSNIPTIVKSWEVASEENSICPIPCFPSALSLFTRSSQCFEFYKSVTDFVYWKAVAKQSTITNLFSMFSWSLTSTTATSSSFELATSTQVESHQIKS